MNTTKECFAVIYPFGTSNSYELFAERADALAFIDDESDHTNIILPDGTLTLLEFCYSIEEIAAEIEENEDWEERLPELALSSVSVDHWRLREVWAERQADGELVYLADGYEDKPESENGGEVVEAWADDDLVYETREEGASANVPSNYI